MYRKFLIVATLGLFTLPGAATAQTLQRLLHQPPNGVLLALQLTDGSVLVQGRALRDWWRLTPANDGSYVNGTWSRAASLPAGYAPEDMASAVLADGRVIIEGGEYNEGAFTLSNQGAVYDPVHDSWTRVKPPPGWSHIGDSPATVLPDGRFLIGNKLTQQMAALDPATMGWTPMPHLGKADFNAEEGWTLLPDGSVLALDVKNAPNSEIYSTASQSWKSAGTTPVDLHSPSPFGCQPYGLNGSRCYYPPGEIGPAILRPDGTVFATGSFTPGYGAGNTAVYDTASGQWTLGPVFPNGDNAGDSYAVLLPSGNVLVKGATGQSYEFDGTRLIPGPITEGNLLLLATGEVLVGGGTTSVYRSTGSYQAAWQPTIATYPPTVARGGSYTITGTQFNGLSQANAYGDELQAATNYPLVRITHVASGQVFYARTHDHSTMGVATGATPVSTRFDVPPAMPTGMCTLVVVANGIPSQPVSLELR